MSSTTVTTNHKRIVEQANDAFARNDMEAFLKLCTDDVVWTMVGDTTVTGGVTRWCGPLEG